MNYASATDQTWYCNTCKEDRDTAFCPVCGTARPDMSKEDRSAKSWPVIELVGTDTSLRTLSDDEQRHDAEPDEWSNDAERH